jgi:hypothetical protein
MSYGPLRLIATTYITDAEMLTASAWADGIIGGATKNGSGAAVMEVTGTYSATVSLRYTIEIDSVTGGVDVGQATFRWRTHLTAEGTWEETGCLTATTPAYALTADGRNSGVSVAWTGWTGGDDFALGDVWTFEGWAEYSAANLVDNNPMSVWDLDGTSGTLVIDLGSAQEVTAAILGAHNLTNAATVTLAANSTDAWTTPPYEYTWTTITDALSLYLDEEYRYWRLSIADAGNPADVEIGLFVLGDYIEFEEQPNAVWGSSQIPGLVLQRNESESGVMRDYCYGERETLSLSLGNTLQPVDYASLVAVRDSLINHDSGTVAPLWVHLFSDEPETLWLMKWANLHEWTRVFQRGQMNAGVTMELSEVVRV